jgi:hypothetical protein
MASQRTQSAQRRESLISVSEIRVPREDNLHSFESGDCFAPPNESLRATSSHLGVFAGGGRGNPAFCKKRVPPHSLPIPPLASAHSAFSAVNDFPFASRILTKAALPGMFCVSSGPLAQLVEQLTLNQ